MRQRNPTDSEGNTLKCAVCESIFHFAAECPDSYENLQKVLETTEEEIYDSSEEAHQCDVQLEPAEVFIMESSDDRPSRYLLYI